MKRIYSLLLLAMFTVSGLMAQIITNGGFDDGTGWSVVHCTGDTPVLPTYGVDDDATRPTAGSGKYATWNGGGGEYIMYQTVKLKVGSKYTLRGAVNDISTGDNIIEFALAEASEVVIENNMNTISDLEWGYWANESVKYKFGVAAWGVDNPLAATDTTFQDDGLEGGTSVSGVYTVPSSLGDAGTEVDYHVLLHITGAVHIAFDEFVVTKMPSADATLSDLTIDGTSINGFDAATISYDVALPVGTTDIPVVAATETDENANSVITQATGLPGSATVVVTAEDESTETYTVNFTVIAAGADATLSDLTVNGTTVTGFDALTMTYDIALPIGTTDIPVVAATETDEDASSVITQATELPGSATVVVTAQDETTELTYTINFTVIVASTDATLSDLTVDGTTVTGFDAATISYDVVLAEGTTDIPVVAATETDENASSVITQATGLPGSATVVVTAEDGTTELTYTVNFTVTPTNAINSTSSDLAVTIYPNPVTNGKIHLSFGSVNNEVVSVSIMSITGKTVYSSTFSASSEYTIDGLDNFAKGIYLLNISTNNESKVYKIMF